MNRIGKLTAGTMVGAVLIIGIGTAAGAAPVTTTTTSPSTPSPTTTAPGTPSPNGTAPTGSASTKPKAMTGNEIWWVVRPHHAIECAHAAKQVQRVRAADTAASKRLGRWQTKQATDQKIKSKNAAKRNKRSSGKVNGFQKLEQDGQALIRRIDAKCGLTSTAG